jgi:hypothetical protein
MPQGDKKQAVKQVVSQKANNNQTPPTSRVSFRVYFQRESSNATLLPTREMTRDTMTDMMRDQAGKMQNRRTNQANPQPRI